MAIKFLNNVSLEGNEIQNVKLQNLATDPVSGSEGQVIFNTASGLPKYYDGFSWVDWGGSSGTVTSIATGEGLTGGPITASGTISLKNNSSFTDEAILKWDDANTQFVDSLISDNGTTVTIGGALNVTGAISGNASTATSLATSRDFSISGDITAPSVSFDGTANVGLVSTLATVNSNVGSFGGASVVGTFTVNGKGLITAAADTSIAITSSQVTDFTTEVSAVVDAREYAIDIGDGASTTYTVTHGLNTRDVIVQAYSNLTPYDTVTLSVERTNTTQVTLNTTSPIALQAVRVLVTKIG